MDRVRFSSIPPEGFTMWVTGTGRLIYDPPRPGMKRRTEWWAVLRVDDGYEISRYLRWLIKRNYLDAIELNQQAWSAHCSVIRGEKPKPELMHLWKKYNNQKYSFRYSTEIIHQNKFWFVLVDCPPLLEIRKELKLPVNYPLHMTVAKDKFI